MNFIPGETLGNLGQFLTLKDILALATSNKDFRENFLRPDVNKQLANHFGFPYNLTLTELKRYEETNFQVRLNIAAKAGDMRVVKKVIELHEQDPFEILSRLDVTTGQTLKLPSKTTLNFNIPLYEAAESGHMEILKYLIEKGANEFNIALRRAIPNGHEKIVEYLIEKGANNLNKGLVDAARYGWSEIVDLLISHGANNFNEALKAAVYSNHEEIVEKLIAHGADNFNEMIFATMRIDSEKLFYRFLNLVGDINDISVLYQILDYAIQKDNAKLANQIGKKLYDQGMDITPDQILLKAANHGSIKVAEKMIENGANDLYGTYMIAEKKGYDKFAERSKKIYKSLSQ